MLSMNKNLKNGKKRTTNFGSLLLIFRDFYYLKKFAINIAIKQINSVRPA
jgi:hypothetical protein